jgi:hypothetical protein
MRKGSGSIQKIMDPDPQHWLSRDFNCDIHVNYISRDQKKKVTSAKNFNLSNNLPENFGGGHAYGRAKNKCLKHSGRFRKVNISLGSFVQLACHVKYYMAIKELITRARYPAICLRKFHSRYEVHGRPFFQ